MLTHPAWGGGDVVPGARVLDAFAGTGALGLEALSRGAARAIFMETDVGALRALRANIAALGAAKETAVLASDVLRCPPCGAPAGLAFLDPPYGAGLLPRALAALQGAGWVASGTIIVGEIGRGEPIPSRGEILAQRAHGAARLVVWRAEPTA